MHNFSNTFLKLRVILICFRFCFKALQKVLDDVHYCHLVSALCFDERNQLELRFFGQLDLQSFVKTCWIDNLNFALIDFDFVSLRFRVNLDFVLSAVGTAVGHYCHEEIDATCSSVDLVKLATISNLVSNATRL